MALHTLTSAQWHHGQWYFTCACTAWFGSPVCEEAGDGFRRHMSEPALPAGGAS